MRNIRELLRLCLGERLSLRKAAASLEMPLTTVREHLQRARAAGVTWPLPEGLDDDDLEAMLFPKAPAAAVRPTPEWKKIHVELRRPHVTLMLLWIEYRESNPDGYAYSQFCELYRRFRRGVDLVMRQEHKAGEKLFVDFPGAQIPIYDEATGKVLFCAELFVAALGASSYLYVEAVRSQELLYFVTAHVHTFEALGGVPEICVCDNLRSGVTHPHRYEPDVNATYQDMAAHYNVAIIPARSYKPRDKALSSHCTSWVAFGYRYGEWTRRHWGVGLCRVHLSTVRSGPTSSSTATGASHSGQQPPMPTRRANVPHSQRCSPSALLPQASHS
ncbi:MAG: IS21 family transposase [Actinomycetota bacterium]|nr:IS21 family transposase [Actinomycetota bacterium]